MVSTTAPAMATGHGRQRVNIFFVAVTKKQEQGRASMVSTTAMGTRHCRQRKGPLFGAVTEEQKRGRASMVSTTAMGTRHCRQRAGEENTRQSRSSQLCGVNCAAVRAALSSSVRCWLRPVQLVLARPAARARAAAPQPCGPMQELCLAL